MLPGGGGGGGYAGQASGSGHRPRPAGGAPAGDDDLEELPLVVPQQGGSQEGWSGASAAEGLQEILEARGLAGSYDPASKAATPPPARRVLFDFTDKRIFLTSPGKRREMILCHIKRTKRKAGMFPEYALYLDDGNSFLLSARKRKKSKSSNYIISLDEEDLARESGNYFGKLRSNFMGTEFTIFDKGEKPSSRKGSMHGTVRAELGACLYDSNILGTRGPRKMTVVLPLVKEGGKRVVVRPDEGDPGLLDQYRKASTATRPPPIHVCTNKKPSWNKNLGAYTLNFNGRVTEASVKNFQMQLEPEGESGSGGGGRSA